MLRVAPPSPQPMQPSRVAAFSSLTCPCSCCFPLRLSATLAAPFGLTCSMNDSADAPGCASLQGFLPPFAAPLCLTCPCPCCPSLQGLLPPFAAPLCLTCPCPCCPSLQGFLPEEWDVWIQDTVYPSYSPTVIVFLACSSLYGLFKIGKLPGQKQL